MTCLWYLTVRENTMTKIATDARYIGLHIKTIDKDQRHLYEQHQS